MIILSIDTTQPTGSVAITDGGSVLAEEQQGNGNHAEKLIYSIEKVLFTAKVGLKDIGGIAVAIGPGSFTGLRIGLATAKGLALAIGVPIAGASSLASLALNGRGFSGTVVPLIDARRGELYAGAWRVDSNGKMRVVSKECVAPPEEIARLLKKIKGEILVVGDGAIAYGKGLVKSLGQRARIAEGTQVLPQAANLAELAREKLESGKGDDIAALVPNYIRYSDAEIGFMGRKQ